jgi:serine protease AprX
MKKIISAFALFFVGLYGYSQIAPDKYFVEFTDKNGTPYSVGNPSAFLSQRAIERRAKQSVLITEEDLPVNPSYIQQVKNIGVTVLNPSKWLNGITIFTNDSTLISQIEALPFVLKVDRPVHARKYILPHDKFRMEEMPVKNPSIVTRDFGAYSDSSDYGASWTQIHMLNGEVLHNNGYRGQGMVIAILDAGFENADIISPFDSLRANGQILGTRDFVLPGNNVYNEYYHGTSVLSTMGAIVHGALIGTAPKADFWLLRTEDVSSENIIEEYNWVSGAEFADSAGADVINSSLGYTTFDLTQWNHTWADITGHSTVVTRGANMAASKGMMVCNSAGNDGNNSWKLISFPSDGEKVICVAAVDGEKYRAGFSSYGKTIPGLVKPNVAAMGAGTIVAGSDGSIFPGYGTSFSSPVTAGMVACLWQSRPEVPNNRLFDAIMESCSQYSTPDTLLGYGIPDFSAAFQILSTREKSPAFSAVAYPNPCTTQVSVSFHADKPDEVTFNLFDQVGRKVLSQNISRCLTGQNNIILNGVSSLNPGLYVLQISSPGFTGNIEIEKL